MTAVKKYRFDRFLDGVAIKAPCVVATNVNLTLHGEQTVNTIAVVAGDRVLVKNQSSAIENGIYIVSTSAWRRASDFKSNSDALNGTLVIVSQSSAPSSGMWLSDFWAVDFWRGDFWIGSGGAAALSLYALAATNPVQIGVAALNFNVLVL